MSCVSRGNPQDIPNFCLEALTILLIYQQLVGSPCRDKIRRGLRQPELFFPTSTQKMSMAKRGRPPGWMLDHDQPGPVHREALWIDARGRMTIPAVARERTSWLADGGQKLTLFVCEDPGRIKILPWDPYGHRVFQRRRELLTLEPTSEVLEAILEIEDRYLRQSIETGGRVNLSEMALTHLEIRADLPTYAILVCISDVVEIWSVTYRRNRRKATLDILDDLP